jgi:hypothetical protein
MLWFFEKRRARLHYEIRRQTDGPDYELVITFPDGREEIERFSNPDAIVERSLALQLTLVKAGWQPPTAGALQRLTPERNAGRQSEI